MVLEADYIESAPGRMLEFTACVGHRSKLSSGLLRTIGNLHAPPTNMSDSLRVRVPGPSGGQGGGQGGGQQGGGSNSSGQGGSGSVATLALCEPVGSLLARCIEEGISRGRIARFARRAPDKVKTISGRCSRVDGRRGSRSPGHW